MAQYDVDLRDYWRIIRKRKTYIIFLVIIVGICSLGFAKIKEPVPLYEAVAAIKIDRSANIGSILTGTYWNQAENMDTHAYIIKSFPVLAKAAQSMGQIPQDLSLDDIRSNKTYLSVIQQLKAMVEIDVVWNKLGEYRDRIWVLISSCAENANLWFTLWSLPPE